MFMVETRQILLDLPCKDAVNFSRSTGLAVLIFNHRRHNAIKHCVLCYVSMCSQAGVSLRMQIKMSQLSDYVYPFVAAHCTYTVFKN